MTPRHIIEIKKGVKVELLFTPSIYGVASRRGLSLTISDRESAAEVMEAYEKLIYIAALNAWEARAYDDPEIEPFAFKLMDFKIWHAENERRFSELVPVVFECITGRTLAEAAKESEAMAEEEKKKNAEEVKKKGWRIFRSRRGLK